MEGTLLDGEILNEVAALHGHETGGQVAALTRLAMNGELSLENALCQRLALLKGKMLVELQAVAASLPLVPHARELIAGLKMQGHRVAIITGSFGQLVSEIGERLGVEHLVAHSLDVKDGALTGGFKLAYRDKGEVMKRIAAECRADFTVAIGDGANDLSMLEAADIGIAFRAKEVLGKRQFLVAEDMWQLNKLFNPERRITIDKSLDAVAARLFSAIGKVTSCGIPQNTNVLLIRTKTKVTKELLEELPMLEVVGTATTGTDHINRKSAAERGVSVFDAKGANADAVADYVMRMLLFATDDVTGTVHRLRQSRDLAAVKAENRRTELNGKTLGIVGLGRIGKKVRQRAEAFGMVVKAYDPYKEEAVHTLSEVLACNIVTLHPELTDETRGMIGRDELAQMRSGSILINASRGEIVDEHALIEALQRDPTRKAVIDVFLEEPQPSPLYNVANALCTPHIAGNSEEGKRMAALQLFQEIASYYIRGDNN